jgi:hypothetical protein
MLGAWEAPFVAQQLFLGVFASFAGWVEPQKQLDRGQKIDRIIV